jgi:predicted anti-sigma-YlaC factor YlaD
MRRTPTIAAFVMLLVASAASPGCALKKMAMGSIANSLSKSGDTFAADDDPELVRAAVPFSLKLVESLLAELPEHRGLLLSACSGFTQYAYAFVETEAERARAEDYPRFTFQQDRSRRLYLRARDYCLRSLEVEYPGISSGLVADAATTLKRIRKADLPLLYWTGAAWGKAVSISLDRPELIADLPAVMAIIWRGLELDESFNRGALHEMMIALESVPEAMGGSPDRARQHFERALVLSNRASAGPYVSFARSALVSQQRRAEFVDVLQQALSIDVDAVPSLRLANILAQQQAEYLLRSSDDLFLVPAPVGDDSGPSEDVP